MSRLIAFFAAVGITNASNSDANLNYARSNLAHGWKHTALEHAHHLDSLRPEEAVFARPDPIRTVFTFYFLKHLVHIFFKLMMFSNRCDNFFITGVIDMPTRQLRSDMYPTNFDEYHDYQR